LGRGIMGGKTKCTLRENAVGGGLC
jgi:hypothetical protein